MHSIYLARNKMNGMSYIGATSSPVCHRMSRHKHGAIKRNEGGLFGAAIREFGWDSFEWSVVSTTDNRDELMALEQQAIAFYNTFEPNGYNMTFGGDGTWGLKRTEEDSRNRSRKLKQYFSRPEVKAHFSEIRKGRAPWNKGQKTGPLSDAVKQKLSAVRKGRKAWNKGIPHSEEAKSKMRSSSRHLPPVNKGVPVPDARRAKISASLRKLRRQDFVPIEMNGVCYFSVADAGRMLKLSRMRMNYLLLKGRATRIKVT